MNMKRPPTATNRNLGKTGVVPTISVTDAANSIALPREKIDEAAGGKTATRLDKQVGGVVTPLQEGPSIAAM